MKCNHCQVLKLWITSDHRWISVISCVSFPSALQGLNLNWTAATTWNLLWISHLQHSPAPECSLSQADQRKDPLAHCTFWACGLLGCGVWRPQSGLPHLEVWWEQFHHDLCEFNYSQFFPQSLHPTFVYCWKSLVLYGRLWVFVQVLWSIVLSQMVHQSMWSFSKLKNKLWIQSEIILNGTWVKNQAFGTDWHLPIKE